MFRVGTLELVVIFLIILLLFGAKKLPEISRAMGRSLKEFKKGIKDVKDEVDESDKDAGDQEKTSKE